MEGVSEFILILEKKKKTLKSLVDLKAASVQEIITRVNFCTHNIKV